MTLAERIESFTELGQIIRDSLGGKKGNTGSSWKNLFKTSNSGTAGSPRGMWNLHSELSLKHSATINC